MKVFKCIRKSLVTATFTTNLVGKNSFKVRKKNEYIGINNKIEGVFY